MTNKKIVVALGHDALGTTLPEQKIAVGKTSKAIADFVENDNQIIITHSNGPQVGMIHMAMSEFSRLYPDYTPAPMSVCSAMSQGYIGYDLQNAIRTELLNRGIYKTVSTILTQVCVDPYDDAFYHPTKIIGRIMTEKEAELEENKGNYCTEVEGGYRRIVASPKPLDIVEIDAINTLSDAGQIVIACGGGGIPVLEQSNKLKGASAVIEKDIAAGRLAEMTHADMLIMFTQVPNLYLHFGTDKQTPVAHLTVEEAKAHIADGQFEAGTMLPKIEAAISFIGDDETKSVLITNLASHKDAMDGEAGTIITL
jgi:carbamate kinase